MEPTPHPPRWAVRLLTWLHPPETLEEVQGDLQELFTHWHQRAGTRQARIRYAWNVLSLLPPFVRRRAKGHSYPQSFFLQSPMIGNYFKVAFRHLIKNKVYSLLNVLGLAIGVSASLVIYLIVRFELSYDTFHPDRERIYRAVSHMGFAGETFKNGGVSGPVPLAVRREFTGLETVSAFHTLWIKKILVPGGKGSTKELAAATSLDDPGKTEYIIADPQYFEIFKYQWLVGNPGSLTEPYRVVLSESKVKQYFGAVPPEKAIGKILTYVGDRDTLTAMVSGIVKDWQQNTDLQFKDFISFATVEQSQWKERFGLENWESTTSSSQLFVKLAPNTPVTRVENQFRAFIKRRINKKELEADAERKFLLQPLSDLHYNGEYGDDYGRVSHLPTLYALVGAAGFLLLMAIINFVSLATALSTQRAKEVGVRKVLGSSRWNLVVQLLSETLLITAGAVLLSVLLTNPILLAFRSFLPAGVVLEVFSPAVWLFLLGLTLATALLAGGYPALVLSAYRPVQSLKNQVTSGNTRKAYLRKILTVFQFSVSQVFIVGAFVVGAQIHFILGKDLGFKKDQIITFRTFWLDKSPKRFVLLNQIRQMPEVEMASLSNYAPALSGANTTVIRYAQGKKDVTINVHRRSGDENFIQLYGIKLLAGRNIHNSDSARELLINQTCAKQLGFRQPEEAIGQLLIINDNLKLPVVGVVADFHVQPLHKAIQPVFITAEDKNARTISLKLKTSDKQDPDAKAVMAKIEKHHRALYPDQKFEYAFFDETVAKFYERETRMARIVNTATTLAILIACLGLFGLAAFTATQRTKEIGIRKVLGATVANIVGLLSTDFLRLVLLANLIAWPLAWWAMGRWLEDFAYRIPLSWEVFVLAGVSALVIALLTIGYQAVRAALANPVKSLRTE